ncbi:MAG: hypothetical protein FJ134_05815 [Deltaproteobacteria bacterium]|nr:hypothetical protein [Deltaproteobacteria bacterium]
MGIAAMTNRKKVTPVYVFDEHNEAYYYWHEAKYGGYINEPLDLFHIDAHSDMMKIDCIQTSIYFPNDSQVSYLEYYKNIAKNEFNIGNFIIPAILNGLVKNVYFIFPKWKNYKAKRMKYNVSSMFGEGKLFKHCLTINKDKDHKLFQALPDFKYYNYFFLPIDSVPKARKVILDIDLDYFACGDSNPSHMIFELEITEEQFDKQEIFLQDETLKIAGLDFRFIEKNERFYAHIANKREKDESKSYLPLKPEIVFEIDRLITTLKVRKIRPLVVTISRSCVSGFCPKDYAEFIENELLQRLLFLLDK